MFELDEYGYMVPAFIPEDLDDSTWMFAFTYVSEIALSVFDPCEYCECECGGGEVDGHGVTCEWNGEEYPF